MTLRSVGEDQLVRLLTENLPLGPDCLAGAGDDCAVIARDETRFGLLKTDCVIEGVHFTPVAEPEAVGWKAAARVVSDFAAMGGGQPEHALVTLLAPGEREVAWVEGVYRGLRRCADQFGFGIVGGETSISPVAVISISLSGSIARDRCVFRSGAKEGDWIYVTGTLGGSLAGKHLDFVPRMDEARWLAAQPGLHAMMDLSDGLAKDLPRLARASHAGFQIELEQLPLSPGTSAEEGLKDGEDYELLFAVAPEAAERIEAAWPFPLRLSRIGSIVAPEHSQALEGGWDPFIRP